MLLIFRVFWGLNDAQVRGPHGFSVLVILVICLGTLCWSGLWSAGLSAGFMYVYAFCSDHIKGG